MKEGKKGPLLATHRFSFNYNSLWLLNTRVLGTVQSTFTYINSFNPYKKKKPMGHYCPRPQDEKTKA